MSEENPLQGATSRLQLSLERLERAVDRRLSRDHIVLSAEEEVQRMTADRSRLASELDVALTRASRLDAANREVSRRLVAAMETIRDVIAQRRG